MYRKRRVTENAFGIWVHRFQLFSVRNNLNEHNISTIVLASLVLHNMLREKSAETYTPKGFIDEIDCNSNIRNGSWRDETESDLVCSLISSKQNNFSKSAGEVRNSFKDYFYGPGQVPSQWKVFV